MGGVVENGKLLSLMAQLRTTESSFSTVGSI